MRTSTYWLATTLALIALALASLSGPPARASVGTPAAPTAPLLAALTLVPSDDGTSLYIDLEGVSQQAGTLFANIGIGPGHNKGSWTMAYSATNEIFVTTAAGFTPRMATSSTLDITTTTGLATSTIEFTRAFVPDATQATVTSADGALRLDLLNQATLPADSYIAVAPSFAPPGLPPTGYRGVGPSYSVRASGAVLLTDWPMNLRLDYTDATLSGADPQTLTLAYWEPEERHWIPLDSRLAAEQRYVSAATPRFTAYRLLSGPIWHDDLDDLQGLDLAASSGVTLGLSGDELALLPADNSGAGVAVSLPITAAAGAGWGAMRYTANVPEGTSLAVDLLAADGTLLLSDLANGADLAAIDRADHPTLRLRARLASSSSAARPALFAWSLSWEGTADPPRKIYVPLLQRP